jgi:hypothetical protein
MVEFALVGGLFFFLVFSIMNAGFFLYGRGAVQYAADIGVATIAAEGNCPAENGSSCQPDPAGCSIAGSDADQVALCRMDQAGLTTTPLFKVTQIVVWEESEQANGTFANVTSGCPGGPCEDIYNVYGTVVNNGGTAPWPPNDRNVSPNNSSFVELSITYQYSLLVSPGTFTLTTNNIFRLEPQ